MKKIIGTISFYIVIIFSLTAQNTETKIVDEEELFGGFSQGNQSSTQENRLINDKTNNSSGDLTKELTSSGIGFSGSFLYSIKSPDSSNAINSFTQNLGLQWKVDARPDDSIRVLARGALLYNPQNGDIISSISELFADYDWANTVFFKAGKQTVNWGVGQTWSPADVLSLTAIDPLNPTSDREGPTALKISIPFGTNQFYFYSIANDAKEWDDIMLAAKMEFVLGTSEFGIAGIYRPDLQVKPRLIGMGNFSWFDVIINFETVVSFGSERILVEKDSLGIYTVLKNDTNPLFQGQIGLSWSYSNPDNFFNLSLNGQYYFNGAGTSNPEIYTTIPVSLKKTMNTDDLTGYGMHYAKINIGLSRLFGTTLSTSVSWLSNIVDLSGVISSSFSYTISNFGASLGLNCEYAQTKGEFAKNGTLFRALVKLSVFNSSIDCSIPLDGSGAFKLNIKVISGSF